MPATALISGGLGALGSVGGALIQGNAASEASKQQAATAEQALALQASMFGTAQSTLAPLISQGVIGQRGLLGFGRTGAGAQSALAGVGSSLTQGAGSPLATLKSLLTPGTDMMTTLENLPGFKLMQKYGGIGAQNALTAQGLGGSAGPVGRALTDYGTGLAGTYYGNFVNQLQGLTNTGVGALGTSAGLGAGAYGSAAGVGGSAGSALAGGAISSGNSQAQTLGSLGNAQAAGTLGFGNALAGGLTGASGSISNALLLSQALGGGGLGGGGGGGGLYGPSYGGGNFLTDAWGGSASRPLPGLTSADYG